MRLIARVAAITCVAVAINTPQAVAQQRRPNIVVIVADDMGYADLGVYGCRDIPTPNIDALAASGIRFTDAYVSGPYCGPTRAGLLTGRYPQRFGQEFNLGIMRAHQAAGLPVTERTLADHLKAAGYRTALIGKWHLGTAPQFFPTRRGFDEFFGFLGGAHSYIKVEPQLNPLYDGERIVQSVTYLTDTLATRAVEFIERNRSQPFFLYLAFNAVHDPLEAPDRYMARFSSIADTTRRTYAAMLSAMDDGIGRTLAALRKNGLDDRTLVVFLNDNGGPLTPAQWNGSSNAPLRGQKSETWEGGIRVPFIVRWTGKLPRGKTDSRPIIQLDVMPTALAAAGIPVRPEWHLDGVNLLPYLSGHSSIAPHDALYWRLGGIMATRMGRWKLVKMSPDGAADDPATLTLDGAELFDLANDIGEKENIATRHPEKVRELSDAFQRWNAQLARPLWPPQQGYRGAPPQSCLDPAHPRPLEAYAGTWHGQFGMVVTWTWVLRADSTGTIAFADDTTRTRTRVTFASSDSLVADVTAPVSTPRGMATMHFVCYLCEDELQGGVNIQHQAGSARRVSFRASRPSSHEKSSHD
jgi:arylsulfatase A-like enzyme